MERRCIGMEHCEASEVNRSHSYKSLAIALHFKELAMFSFTSLRSRPPPLAACRNCGLESAAFFPLSDASRLTWAGQQILSGRNSPAGNKSTARNACGQDNNRVRAGKRKRKARRFDSNCSKFCEFPDQKRFRFRKKGLFKVVLQATKEF